MRWRQRIQSKHPGNAKHYPKFKGWKGWLPAFAGMLWLLCFVFAQAAHAGTGDTTTGLVSHWKFDETSGTAVSDSAGSNNGIWQNSAAVASVPGVVDSGFESDPALNTYVWVADPADGSLDFGTGDFTVSVWVKTSGYVGQGSSVNAILGKDGENGLGGPYYTLSLDNDSIVSFVAGGGGSSGQAFGSAINDNQWHHVVGVRESGTLKIYVDTVQGSNGSFAGIVDNGNGLNIGTDARLPGNRIFPGQIDEVRIYNRALTADDVTALYVRSNKYCDNPTDAPGVIRYNADRSALQYCDGEEWVMMGLGSYMPVAVSFDGINDYNTAALAGTQDSKKWTGSFWLRRYSPSGAGTKTLLDTDTNDLSIDFFPSDELVIDGQNDAGTRILRIRSSAITDTDWHHILFSVDMADTGKRHIYVDGVSDLATVNDYIDDVLDFTNPTLALGAGTSGSNKFDGDLADLWLDFGTYIDFSSAALREKFRSANGMPMYLGADGSLPTGNAPDIFLSGDVSDWPANKGAGGGFTPTGALAHSSSQIPYSLEPNLSAGLQAHWKLDESGAVTIADDTIGTEDLTLTNFADPAASWKPAKFRNGLQFNSANSEYAIVNGTIYGPPYTFTMWFRLNSDPAATMTLIQSGWENSCGWSPNVEIRSNEAISVETGSCGVSNRKNTAAGIVDIGTWHFLTMIGTSDGWDLYLDGRMVESSTQAPSASANDCIQFGVGNVTCATPNSEFFDGDMDDIRLYSRALSRAEIMMLYTGTCAGPLGAGGEMIYNTDHKVMQYCNGRDWVALSKIGGTGGGGCASPAGVAGDIRYASADDVMQYCNSEDWVAVGKPVAPTNGLIGHWRLDENSGGVIYDSTGLSDAGTWFNNGSNDTADDTVAGKLGSALHFGGSHRIRNVDMDGRPVYDEMPDLTVCQWFYSEANQDRRFFRSLNGSNETYLHLGLKSSSGQLQALIRTSNDVTYAATSANLGAGYWNNAWHHICMTFDRTLSANRLKLYADGELLAQNDAFDGNMAFDDFAANGDIQFGWDAWDGTFFTGKLDDVRIYSRALSTREIKQLYNATR